MFEYPIAALSAPGRNVLAFVVCTHPNPRKSPVRLSRQLNITHMGCDLSRKSKDSVYGSNFHIFPRSLSDSVASRLRSYIHLSPTVSSKELL